MIMYIITRIGRDALRGAYRNRGAVLFYSDEDIAWQNLYDLIARSDWEHWTVKAVEVGHE